MGVLLVLLSACSDGSLFSPNDQPGSVRLALRPLFSAMENGSAMLDINRIRVTVRVQPSGDIAQQSVQSVDPGQSSWALDLDVPANSTLEILIELLNVNGSSERIEYSGTVEVRTTTGLQPQPEPVAVVRGGPENLRITSVTIAPRDQNVLEGDVVNLSASVGGNVTNPTIVWRSLNEAVATVDDAGKVTARAPGQATIVAVAGTKSDNVTVNVGQLATNIEIAAPPTIASIGAEATLAAVVRDARNTAVPGIAVTWSTPDTAIATQVAPGVFRARRNGTATVTATAVQRGRTITANATLKVEQRAVSVVISPLSATFASLGDTKAFTAQAKDANNNDVAGATFTWSSSNESVATVDANGVATARSNGNASVNVSMSGATASASITVDQQPAVLVISPASVRLTYVGESTRLTAEVRDARGNVINTPVLWSTGQNPNVAVVAEDGTVTAGAAGRAVINAQAGRLRASVVVVVDQVASQVTMNANTVTVAVGGSFQATAQARDAGGTAISGPVTWTSANPAVAQVSSTGLITGVSQGQTNITATIGGNTGVIRVTVSQPQGSGRFAGRVIDPNGFGLGGATVTFDAGSQHLSATTASDGSFLSPMLATGSWDVSASLTGYISTTYHGAQAQANSTVQLEELVLVPQSTSTGSISGTVRNARIGSGISNATLELRVGQNVTTGQVVATTTANSSGYFEFLNLAPQVYTIVARASGFAEGYRTGVVVGSTARTNQDIVLTPIGNSTDMYVVLTWGPNPRDLDSHLTGPDGSGRFHVYYGNSGSMSSFPFAQLDIDDTSGFGPETITISQLFPGLYRYSVHHYSGSQSIATSGAMVRVYRGSTLVATFTPPSQTGRIWSVFEYDGTTITPIQAISDNAAFRRSPFDLTEPQRILRDVTAHPKRDL